MLCIGESQEEKPAEVNCCPRSPAALFRPGKRARVWTGRGWRV